MATQLGEAQIPIRATLDKLDSDLSGAKSKVLGAVQGIANNVQKVGKVALGIGGAGITAIAGIGAAIGKIAFDAAPVEGLAGAFEGLADSAGVGMDDMLAALKRGSAGMVSNRDLMQSFNQAAQLVSIDFAKQLPDAMQYLGKVSAATGQDMGFLLDSLVKGVGRLSPMILDNLAIQVSQAEATQRASEMFGVEAEALTKAQTQAGMMNVVMEKLAANTAAMPEVTGTAAATMAEFKATIQDTKDQIGMAFLPTLNTLGGVLNDVLGAVLPLVTQALDAIAPVMQQVAEAFGFFVGAILSGEDPIAALTVALYKILPPEIAQGIVDAIRNIRDGIQTVIEVVGPIVQQAAEWIGKNVELQDVLIALGIAIAAVVLPALWSVITAAAPIIATAVALIAVVTLLRKAWESDFLGIRTFVLDTLTKIRAWWAEHGEQVIAKAKEIYNTIKDFIQNALDAIKGYWQAHGGEIIGRAKDTYNTIRDTIKTVIETVRNIVQTVLEAIRGFWERNGADITLIVQTFMTNAKNSVTTLINAIQAVITTVVGAIVAFWQNNWDLVQQIAQNTWDTIKTVVDAAMKVIEEVIKAISAAIRGDWEAFGEHLRSAFDAAWEAIKAICENAIETVRLIFERLITNVKNLFTQTDWGALGRAIIDGIAHGISSTAGKIAEAAKSAAKAALAAAKAFLGIKSPSQAFMQLGQLAGKGFALGLSSTDVIERAAAAMGQVALQGAALGLGRGAASYSTTDSHDQYQWSFQVSDPQSAAWMNHQARLEQRRRIATAMGMT